MRNFYHFLILALATILLSIITREFLDTDELVLNNLAERLTEKQLKKQISFNEKWIPFTYLIIPIMLLIKVSIITPILDVGLFFFEKKIKFKKLFNIVVKAEFVFLLPAILKFLWFYIFNQNYSLQDIHSFYPFSAINIVGYEGLQNWFIYPLQVLNLFEFAYWLILAYLIAKELNSKTEKSLIIVASSYGVALLIWIVAIMFFTLNMS